MNQYNYVKKRLEDAYLFFEPDEQDRVIAKIINTSVSSKIPLPQLITGCINAMKAEQKLQLAQPKDDGRNMVEDLQKAVDPMEAIRMAYLPIITYRAAFLFAQELCKVCVARRLPYKKQTRIIKECNRMFEDDWVGSIDQSTMGKLEAHLQDFLCVAGRDIQTLWWVINQELKRLYPSLNGEYDTLTPLYVCISLLDYTKSVRDNFNRILDERTGRLSYTSEEPYIKQIRKALAEIAQEYTLDVSPMIQMAVKVISNKVDLYVFDDVKVTEDEK